MGKGGERNWGVGVPIVFVYTHHTLKGNENEKIISVE